jgi:hypothetical protein
VFALLDDFCNQKAIIPMDEAIRFLTNRIEGWRQQLRKLESGKIRFGTAEEGASFAHWKDATPEWIEELKVDIAKGELALRELQRLAAK